MASRGQVFWPKALLPPGQSTKHQCVVLSNSKINSLAGKSGVYLMVAIIRSATNQSGNPVRLVMGHSIPIPAGTLPSIIHDSILETHQLFALNSTTFDRRDLIGALPPALLAQALEGARRVFA